MRNLHLVSLIIENVVLTILDVELALLNAHFLSNKTLFFFKGNLCYLKILISCFFNETDQIRTACF